MKKVALITYNEKAVNYEAFSRLKELSNGKTLVIKQAAIIEKDRSGKKVSIRDGVDYESTDRILRGGLIGMIIGILAGPLGILCGWIIGDVAGMGSNYIKAKKTTTIFDSISQVLDDGSVGLLVYMNESNEDIIDTMLVKDLNGVIVRFNYEEVEADIELAKQHENTKA
ncbi:MULTISPECIES: hypothetical protein [Enterococcus]|uniref:DUF1269 domain-containing protein n=1 Tax=Enterococcus alishanensis TaxID=1303817 RepID=A0ABS6TEJ3_9ENTE|nr:hypothetical protein [Enterococcus alishanensis]MBV7391254.1 hypothetical protein [Enterococcus alishanensis]